MQKRFRFVVPLTCLLSLVCAAADTPAPAIDRDFTIDVQAPTLPEKVTFKARNLFNHADYLAGVECNGRLAGSPGESKARKYIINRLLTSGYEEVRQFQFQFTGDVRLGPQNHVTAKFPSGEKLVSSEYELVGDYRPMPISQSGAGVGTLVFAGYGISAPENEYDDYAGLDVKGKVVLAFRGEPETPDGKRIAGNDPHAVAKVYSDLFYKAGIARDKGALALLIIDGERGKAPEKKIMPDMIRGGGRRHCGLPLIQVLPDVADAWLATARKSAERLKHDIDATLQPSSVPLTGVKLDFQVDIVREKATDYNLAVVLPGTDATL